MEKCLCVVNKVKLVAVLEAGWKHLSSVSVRCLFRPLWQGRGQEEARGGGLGQNKQAKSGAWPAPLQGRVKGVESVSKSSAPNAYTVRITGRSRRDMQKSPSPYLEAQDRICSRNRKTVVVRIPTI